MESSVPTKKLFKTAAYSSLILIGVIAIAPHVISIKSVSIVGFFKGIIFLALFIIFIWLVNILLIFLIEKIGKGKISVLYRYLISYIICLPGIYLSRLLAKPFIPDNDKETEHLYAIFVLGFILNTIVLIMQDLILLREKKARIEIENAELKLKNVEASNQQLKQQIHPHFLFNSLNTLKALIKKDPEKAEDYLLKLSDFLRASFLSELPNTQTLKKELKLCLDYLEMQKMRFGDSLQYSVNIDEEIQSSTSVPVFSLLTLLENTVKHNTLTEEFPLKIEMNYEEGKIVSSNNLQPKQTFEASTGLGLENLVERYRILVGKEINIQNDGKTFSVGIYLIYNENSNY
jgi:sensor histidine kinase YesM